MQPHVAILVNLFQDLQNIFFRRVGKGPLVIRVLLFIWSLNQALAVLTTLGKLA